MALREQTRILVSLFVHVLVVVVALLSLSGGSNAVKVEFNRDHACSYADDAVFPTDATDSLSDPNLLQSYRRPESTGTTATNGGFPIVPCTEVTSDDCGGRTATVVVGVSKCLSDATSKSLSTWFGDLIKQKPMYWQADKNVELKFLFVLLGKCTSPFAANRLSAFNPVTKLPDAKDSKVVAAIMLFKDDDAYKQLQTYEKDAKLTLAFNFYVNEGSSSASSSAYLNSIYLTKIDDLAAYSPFISAVKRYTCTSTQLPDGAPLPYRDSSGNQKCMCTWPKGYELKASGNKLSCIKLASLTSGESTTCSTCIWDSYGPFKYEVSDALKSCNLPALITTLGLPVPYLMDSYVTKESSPESSRKVTITATQAYAPIYDGDDVAAVLYKQSSQTGNNEPLESVLKKRPLRHPSWTLRPVRDPSSSKPAAKAATCAWKKYQEKPADLFNALPITSYGKYNLVAAAEDLIHKGVCSGCVAVVDNYRPHATTACPTSFVDSTVGSSLATLQLRSGDSHADLNSTNLVKADASVQQVLLFQQNAANDACSAAANRCDDESFEIKNFFSDKFTAGKSLADGKTCFSPKSVWTDFLNAADAMKDPFQSDDATLQLDAPVVPQGRCTRCCHLDVKLKEKWVDYLCDSNYDTERCDGLEKEACSYNQCLAFSGDAALTADAQIRAPVVTESKNVVSQLVQQGYDTSTQIHRAISCTSFSEKSEVPCTFKAKVAELVVTSAAFHSDWDSYGSSGKDASKFVFWRYRVAGDSKKWRRLTDGVTHTFSKSETQIVVEAWSQCGVVRAFTFCVYLHVHSPIEVCEHFDTMWYQTSVSDPRVQDVLCNVPKSDFVELTFDYHPNIGLQYSPTKLKMSIKSVVCTASFDGREATHIVQVENELAPEIARRFAVELVREPTTTASLTDFFVQCTFTYLKYDKSTTSQTCDKSFLMQDCDSPCFDRTLGGKCQRGDECGGKKLPGPYEACGSNVVTASSSHTYMNTVGEACCQSCTNIATACVPLLDIPDDEYNIKRCEPIPSTTTTTATTPATNPYSSAYTDYNLVAARSTAVSEIRAAFGAPAFLAAAGAAVVIAVVGLFVWKAQQQRRVEQRRQDDELYSLMESTATTKEIKDAYFKLAKSLHPDVTGNDQTKADLFKNVSEAHSVLSDAQQRRQYDASRPMQHFGPQSTGGGRMHPYAAQKAAEAAARGHTGAPDYTARRMYGIDEEVWIAHHYGVHSRRRNDMPNRYYGMNIVEERIEEEQERIQRRKNHYKLHSSSGYFLRREARLKKRAAEEAAKKREEQKQQSKTKYDGEEDPTNCVIS